MVVNFSYSWQEQIQGDGAGVHTPLPPPEEMTCGFLIQLVFCIKICLRQQSVMPFLSGATPPEKKSWICPWLRLSVLPATIQVRETNKKLFPVYIWSNSNTSLTYKHSIGFETKDTVTLTKDQWAGISPGHYKHDPPLLWEETKK